MEVIFIKFGGSLITVKERPYTARPDVIKRLASEVRDALQERQGLRLVIGNGGGSYGHPGAAKYGTIDGFCDNTGRLGFCKVHDDAIRLNRLVVNELLNHGIPALGLPASAMFLTGKRELVYSSPESIKESLNQEIIPVVFGSPILDTHNGCTIYSADRVIGIIIKFLTHAGRYNITRMVSLGNYEGVLDSHGNIIPEITKTGLNKVEACIKGSDATDVTGGMLSKVTELLDIASMGTESFIANGMVPGNLYKLIMGDNIECTAIR